MPQLGGTPFLQEKSIDLKGLSQEEESGKQPIEIPCAEKKSPSPSGRKARHCFSGSWERNLIEKGKRRVNYKPRRR